MSWKDRDASSRPEPKRKMAGIHYKDFKRDLIITAGLIIILLISKAMS